MRDKDILGVEPIVLNVKEKYKNAYDSKSSSTFQCSNYETIRLPYFGFNIKGIDEFFSKANDLILNAKKEISISIWKEDFPKIEESLSIASKKGIKIYIFSFSDITFPSGEIFSYQLKNPTSLFPYRRISIVVDGKEVTMQVKPGDKVIYSKYAGTEVKLDDEEYIVVKQNDILAVIED